MIDLSKTIDLSTTYLGLKLKNPLVASASPLCEDVGNVRRLEDAGASAVVLHSLFEEQIELESDELDRFITEGSELSAESITHFPELTQRVMGPEAYLAHIVKCKQAVKIPIIASLNGTTKGGWLGYAKRMEQAGADALELNIYYVPVDPNVTGDRVEQQYIELVKAVKAEVKIPVAVKLGPYFSSMANMAKRLDAAGIDGMVLFNRFYQPDFDLEALEVVPNLILSNSHELLLRLHWIAVIYGSVKADLALTGGVAQRDRRGEGHDGGRAGSDDDIGAVETGNQLPGYAGYGAAGLDGRARVRLDQADAGQHEPERGAAAGGIRACELHEGAELVRDAIGVAGGQAVMQGGLPEAP